MSPDQAIQVLREALRALSDMYVYAWDSVNGDLIMMGSGVNKFESAHARAEEALASTSTSKISAWNFDMAAAPKDGTRILVTAHDEPNDRIYPHIAYFSKGQDAWKSDDDYWIDFDHMTAWRELPPAPEKEG